MTPLPDRVTASPSVLSQRVADATVVLDVERAISYQLDEVGSAMWTTLCEAPDVVTAVDRLAARYDVDRATLEADVARFIERLADLAVLRPEG